MWLPDDVSYPRIGENHSCIETLEFEENSN